MDIYEQLKNANIPLDHHESDLYAKVTPESQKILTTYKYRAQVTTFKSQIDNELWYNIPFAFTPFWESKNKSH